MHARQFVIAVLCGVLLWGPSVVAQTQPGTPQAPVRITLDDAVRLALAHNHALAAARTTILLSQAQEVTASVRPNPVLLADAQFLPIFNPSRFTGDYINQNAQFDLGVSYLFERGQKRQHRIQAAKDVTSVTISQVADNERMLTFNVASTFVAVLLAEANLELARQDLQSFQSTVQISEARFKAGDLSEGDFLKIKLQLLQFQTDVSQAELARVQALVGLRQLLGYESVPASFDVAAALDYTAVQTTQEAALALAAEHRPDLRAAIQGVAAAKSQYDLAVANGKRDPTVQVSYSHVSGMSGASSFFNMEMPIFNRNQGEIARTRSAMTQAGELRRASEETAEGDVVSAYQGVAANDRVIRLYRSGYLDEARLSREISEYAYKRGAASLLDFLDAERSYRATQLAYRQSLASYMLAVEQLREATGIRSLP
jgi:cobalt-zinc-cadmium efflux system outer membrane protein